MYRARSAVVLGLLLGLGCSSGNKLETGYEVRTLSASPTEVRGFYAERFTPEARAAAMERDQELEARRPRPGF
jgi:outer membrane murein-binding lipoprotein Lpp